MNKQNVCFRNSRGQKLCGILRIPEGKKPFPAIISIHGFCDGIRKQYTYMCRELTKNGFITLIFDFYNKPNNYSEPKIEDMTITQQLDGLKSAIDFIEQIECVNKNKIGLIGHSLGGMVVILYAPTDYRIRSLVVQAPATNLSETKVFKIFQQAFKEFKEGKSDKYYVELDGNQGNIKIKLLFYEDCLKYDAQKVYGAAKKIRAPTLILHGDMDKIVDINQSKELVKHIENGKLEIIRGAAHNFCDNKTLRVVTNFCINWFNKYLK